MDRVFLSRFYEISYNWQQLTLTLPTMQSARLVPALALAALFLAACAAATFDNFNLIGSATGIEERTIGKNTQKVYMAAGDVDKVCDEQAGLITSAGWTASEEMRREDTYKTGTFSREDSTLTLMCSAQENAGTKVTLTLQN